MPVRGKKWVEPEEQSAQSAQLAQSAQSAQSTISAKVAVKKIAAKTARAKKTARRSGCRTNGGMSTIDKIRMLAAWAEGAMMPDRLTELIELPNVPTTEKGQKKQLHSHLKKATAAIKENPAEFLKNKDFLALIAFLKNTHGEYRLTSSFPSNLLKNKGLLRLLPLPVRIEKHPAMAAEMAENIAAMMNRNGITAESLIAEIVEREVAKRAAEGAEKATAAGTGNNSKDKSKNKLNNANKLNKLNKLKSDLYNSYLNSLMEANSKANGDLVLMELDDEVVTFDWFSTNDPKPDEETLRLISDFLKTMLRAMDVTY